MWALQDYGFEAVISPGFADIFRNNCTKAGLVPVQVEPSVGRILLDAVLAEPTMQITIDIEQGTLEALSARIETTFPLDEFTRARLVNGWDDIGLTLRYEDEIEELRGRPPLVAPQHHADAASRTRWPGHRADSVRLESPPGPRRRLPRGAGGQPASGDPVDVELRNVVLLSQLRSCTPPREALPVSAVCAARAQTVHERAAPDTDRPALTAMPLRPRIG